MGRQVPSDVGPGARLHGPADGGVQARRVLAERAQLAADQLPVQRQLRLRLRTPTRAAFKLSIKIHELPRIYYIFANNRSLSLQKNWSSKIEEQMIHFFKMEFRLFLAFLRRKFNVKVQRISIHLK